MQKIYCLLASLAALLLATAPRLAQAQTTPSGGVGIGITAPDASAALDIVSSTRGLLLPRLTQAQVAAIASPATGLLVYQTDGTPGFYYNAGTPAAPGWQLLGAGTGTGGTTGDNLGNHTATQALNLQGNALVGNGASVAGVGLGIRADGGLNLGQNGGGHNLLLGYQAGQALAPSATATDSVGAFNQFSGYQSGANTTTGSGNLFVGYQTGRANTTANGNQFIGFRAGQATTTGEGNQFSGFNSGLSNTTGYVNVFSGPNSGYSNTTGYANQYLGANAGSRSTTGFQNLFVGYGSGFFNVDGTNNTALGANAGPDLNSPSLTNATALGANAAVSQSNSLVLGNNASVGIGTSAPSQKLEVAGTIYSSAGGFKFPDGTLQTSAATGDNLGDHTATQNLNLGTNTLVGNGGTTGLTVTSAGSARLPAASAYTYAAPKAYAATYGISDMQLEVDDGTTLKLRTTLNGGEFAYVSRGTLALRIPLHLPNGATVTGITCYGVDNDPGQNLQGYFISVLPTATGISTPDYSDGFATSGAPGYVTPVITPGTSTRVIDNNRAYYVLINTSANGCTIGAVRVNYTVTQAE